MNKKRACSEGRLIRFRMVNIKCPTVKSAGIKYFFLSMSGIAELRALSQITGIRSGYCPCIRLYSFFLASREYSDLKEEVLVILVNACILYSYSLATIISFLRGAA